MVIYSIVESMAPDWQKEAVLFYTWYIHLLKKKQNSLPRQWLHAPQPSPTAMRFYSLHAVALI